jgi:hypothetical protein
MLALAASNGLWVGISTGYRKLGLLYQSGAITSARTVTMCWWCRVHPRRSIQVDPNMIARASASDPEAAESEWGGGFRTDISSFIDDATIEAAVNYGRPIELPPQQQLCYKAFVDASGGRHDHTRSPLATRKATASSLTFAAASRRRSIRRKRLSSMPSWPRSTVV